MTPTGRSVPPTAPTLDPQKGAQRVGVVIDGEGKIKEWHARVDARAWPTEVLGTL